MHKHQRHLRTRAGTADLHTGLAGHPCDPPAEGTIAGPPAAYGGVGWSGGNFHDYGREYGVDLVQLAAFLHGTQPEAAEALALSEDGPTRRAFLTRLHGEIAERGTIEAPRNATKRRPLHLDLFYGTPSAHNPQAQERFEQNRFTVTRQLRYSREEAQRALDIGLFINGHGRHGGPTTRRLRLRGMERRQYGEVAIQGSTGRNVSPLRWTTGPIAVQSGRRRSLRWETG